MTRKRSVVGLLSTFAAFSAFIGTVQANLIGFDFGSTFYKITLVQPGNPYTIVENETSLRKTESQMTITPEQRLFAKDSFNGNSRYPKTTFADLGRFLGIKYDEDTVKDLRFNQFFLNDFVEDERGLIAFQSFSIDKKAEEGDVTTYYTEELLAQLFKYGRNLAEKQAKGDVREAVVTVPSYFTAEQRLMMIDAAEMAGLHVSQLVNENTAAATMYGIDRSDKSEDGEDGKIVMFYNMGGGDTEVTVAKYGTLTDPKNKTFDHIEILGEAWDKSLGGNAFDHVLVQILADEFNSMKEREGKPDVRENDRAMKRLYKEVIKIKEVLSANKACDVKIPELLDYVTLKFKLPRTLFEEKAESLFRRVEQPIHDALKEAGLTVDDISQVEIIGGGVRVPKVQEILKEVTKKEHLQVHLNGDEGMCFGSAFIASNSSSLFKVRKLYLTQHPRHDIAIKVSPLTGDSEPTETTETDSTVETPSSENAEEESDKISYYKSVTLYKRKDYLGQKKTINVVYDKAMKIEVFYQDTNEDGEVVFEEAISTYEIPEIDEMMQKEVMQKEDSSKPKVSLQFELSRSQIFNLLTAKISVDETTLEEVKKPKKKAKKAKKEEKEDSDAAATDEEQKEDAEPKEEAEPKKDAETEPQQETEPEATPESDAKEEEAEPEEEKEYKTVIVPHTFTMNFDSKQIGVRRLSKDAIKAAEKRIKALEKRDENKRLNDEARNGYESLIYEIREWFGDEENEVYISEETLESLKAQLEEAEDWIYGEGSEMGYKEYQTRQYDLSTHFTKYKTRKMEHEARVTVIPKMLEHLQEVKSHADQVRETKPWITEEEQSDLVSKCSDMITYIEELMEKQETEGSLTEDATFSVITVSDKMKKVESFAKKILTKKEPKVKKEKKKKEEKVAEEEEQEGGPEPETKEEDPQTTKEEETTTTTQEETTTTTEEETKTETQTEDL